MLRQAPQHYKDQGGTGTHTKTILLPSATTPLSHLYHEPQHRHRLLRLPPPCWRVPYIALRKSAMSCLGWYMLNLCGWNVCRATLSAPCAAKRSSLVKKALRHSSSATRRTRLPSRRNRLAITSWWRTSLSPFDRSLLLMIHHSITWSILLGNFVMHSYCCKRVYLSTTFLSVVTW